MPRSQQPVEGERMIVEEIRRMNYPTILDVGAGSGKWGQLLKDIAVVDAVEVWPANARSIPDGLYRSIYEKDIAFFAYQDLYPGVYDVVILGDVLEHLEGDIGQYLVEQLKRNVSNIFLTIPVTECVQDGNALGNPYETHRFQWSDKELRILGFNLMHVGANSNGLVAIGTYKWTK